MAAAWPLLLSALIIVYPNQSKPSPVLVLPIIYAGSAAISSLVSAALLWLHLLDILLSVPALTISFPSPGPQLLMIFSSTYVAYWLLKKLSPNSAPQQAAKNRLILPLAFVAMFLLCAAPSLFYVAFNTPTLRSSIEALVSLCSLLCMLRIIQTEQVGVTSEAKKGSQKQIVILLLSIGVIGLSIYRIYSTLLPYIYIPASIWLELSEIVGRTAGSIGLIALGWVLTPFATKTK